MPDIGGISLHVIDENETMTNKVSDKPLEDGADISDNINLNPISLSIKFVVSRNGKDVANQLRKLRDSKKVYKYTGIDFNYQNMAIKNLRIPRNSKIKDGFEGTIQLQQVQIVEEVSKVTKLGKEPATGQQVQKSNKETPKRESKSMEVTSTNPRTADLMAYGNKFKEDDANAS